MVKASSQIEEELALLQKRTEKMADALEPLYEGYIKALSEAGKRQLVLAAYHLCTQAYPDKFLALSWDQRNQLQESLQVLAAQIYEQLLAQREQAKKMSRRRQRHNGLAFLQRLLEARAAGNALLGQEHEEQPKPRDQRFSSPEEKPSHQNSSESLDIDTPPTHDAGDREEIMPADFDGGNSESHRFDNNDLDESDFEAIELGETGFASLSFEEDGFDDPDTENEISEEVLDFEMDVPAAEQRLTLGEEEDLLAALEGLARRSMDGQDDETSENEEEQPLAPIHLVKQQVLLDKAIRDVFVTVSEEANALMQKADVMPNFPKALLAAATDAHGMGEPINAVPNVVKVSVRVMQGEALIAPDEDEDSDPLDSDTSTRDTHRDRPPSRHPSGERRRQHDRARENSDRSRERRRSHRDLAKRLSGKGRSDSSIHRIMPHEMIEMDALPELAAISLRLSEVEFTDPTVSAWRSRLRQKLAELKKLGMRYKKTQKALEVAQAEDAWRSSWTVKPSDEAD